MFVRVKPPDDFKDTSGHFPDVFVFRQDVATKPESSDETWGHFPAVLVAWWCFWADVLFPAYTRAQALCCHNTRLKAEPKEKCNMKKKKLFERICEYLFRRKQNCRNFLLTEGNPALTQRKSIFSSTARHVLEGEVKSPARIKPRRRPLTLRPNRTEFCRVQEGIVNQILSHIWPGSASFSLLFWRWNQLNVWLHTSVPHTDVSKHSQPSLRQSSCQQKTDSPKQNQGWHKQTSQDLSSSSSSSSSCDPQQQAEIKLIPARL